MCAHTFSELHRSQRWELRLSSGCTNPPAQGPLRTHFTLALTPTLWGPRLQCTAPSAWSLRASRLPSSASEGGDKESPASSEEHRWSCRPHDSAPLCPLLLVQTWLRIYPQLVRDGEVMEGLPQSGVCSSLVSCPHRQLCVVCWAPRFPFHRLWARQVLWAVGHVPTGS